MDDAKIVQMYFDRDEQAIPATADKYGNYCTSIANNILGNHEDAEECVNDTYLNTWNAIPPHRPKMLSTFLGKIVRNLAFNRYKHNTADNHDQKNRGSSANGDLQHSQHSRPKTVNQLQRPVRVPLLTWSSFFAII